MPRSAHIASKDAVQSFSAARRLDGTGIRLCGQLTHAIAVCGCSSVIGTPHNAQS